jgi:cytidylate kinase
MRRYKELIEKGSQVEYKEVLEDLVQRDYNDSHREIAPLKPAEDGVVLDTTGMNLEESINAIIEIVKEKV